MLGRSVCSRLDSRWITPSSYTIVQSALAYSNQLEMPSLPGLLFTALPPEEVVRTPKQPGIESRDLSREGTQIKKDEVKARIDGSLEQEVTRTTTGDEELEPGEI
jgi:hypothetical protein